MDLEKKLKLAIPLKKGQVIARIDSSLFRSEVEQARANEEVAVASLRGAEPRRSRSFKPPPPVLDPSQRERFERRVAERERRHAELRRRAERR